MHPMAKYSLPSPTLSGNNNVSAGTDNHTHTHHLPLPTPPGNAPNSGSSSTSTLIHTAFAKVYTMPISPQKGNTSSTWTPQTASQVPVSFYFDKHRSVYRILSYDGGRLVINSTVLPTMTFVKPSSAFGLWTDLKLRTIFGLGFTTQGARDMAAEAFERVVKAAKDLEEIKQRTPTSRAGGSLLPPPEGMMNLNHNSVNRAGGEGSGPGSGSGRIGGGRIQEDPREDKLALAVGGAIREQSLRNIQYEEERDRRMAELQKELYSLQSLHAKTHDSLLKAEERYHETEERLEKEKSERERLDGEVGQLKGILEQQNHSISELMEKNGRLERELEVAKEILHKERFTLDGVHEHVEKLFGACGRISSGIQDVQEVRVELQERLKLRAAGQEEIEERLSRATITNKSVDGLNSNTVSNTSNTNDGNHCSGSASEAGATGPFEFEQQQSGTTGGGGSGIMMMNQFGGNNNKH